MITSGQGDSIGKSLESALDGEVGSAWRKRLFKENWEGVLHVGLTVVFVYKDPEVKNE